LIILLAGASALVGVAGRHIWTTCQRLVHLGRHAAAQAVQTEREANRAFMVALQARMEPALLFRTIDTVAAMATTDPVAAEKTTVALGSYLRQSLRREPKLAAPLSEEIDSVKAYLDVFTTLESRFEIAWAIDVGAGTYQVPCGVLRTFIDYAVIRCQRVLQSPYPHIAVKAYVHANHLVLFVRDSAPPDPPTAVEPQALTDLRIRIGVPPKRREVVVASTSIEVDGTSRGTRQTLLVPLD
jgi:LytS/YehU family sensor histidine kinase